MEFLDKLMSACMNKFHVKSNGTMPTRGTPHSAGYDFYAIEDTVIPANTHAFIDTGVQVELNAHEYMMLCVRSSIGKQGVILSNGVGIIDSDYYHTGETIKGMLHNTTDKPFTLNKGDRFMQGIIMPYSIVANDIVRSEKRTGGLGSTGK